MRCSTCACLLFVLLAALPFVNGGCNGTKVVVFSGMPRGNVELWRSTVERLIKPNALDVIFDLWTPPNKSKAELLDVFGPYLCTYFEEEYSLEWKAALVRRYPAFQLRPPGKAAQVWVNGNPCNSVHMVDAYYRLAHANELLARVRGLAPFGCAKAKSAAASLARPCLYAVPPPCRDARKTGHAVEEASHPDRQSATQLGASPPRWSLGAAVLPGAAAVATDHSRHPRFTSRRWAGAGTAATTSTTSLRTATSGACATTSTSFRSCTTCMPR